MIQLSRLDIMHTLALSISLNSLMESRMLLTLIFWGSLLINFQVRRRMQFWSWFSNWSAFFLKVKWQLNYSSQPVFLWDSTNISRQRIGRSENSLQKIWDQSHSMPKESNLQSKLDLFHLFVRCWVTISTKSEHQQSGPLLHWLSLRRVKFKFTIWTCSIKSLSFFMILMSKQN